MRRSIVRTVSWEGTVQQVWDYPAPAAAADRAPTIVMVHGFRGDHHGLELLVEELPMHRVLLADLPGFGQGQELPGTHDVAAYARFIRACVLGLAAGTDDRVVLLGHSFGSVVAAEAAVAEPGIVRALVLVNPISTPALEGPSRLASRLAEAYYVAADRLPERAGLALLSNAVIVRGMSVFMATTKDRSLRRWIHGQHAAYFSSFASRRVVLEAFRASISGTVRDQAAYLGMPVLLVAAEQDPIGSAKSQHELANLVPQATLRMIPGVGHLIHYEKPHEAALLIEEFLDVISV